MLDQRLVCLYLDDSGQQSHGRFFVVAGLAIWRDRAAVSQALRQAEADSGKHQRDWSKTTESRRVAYLRQACEEPTLRGQIFYHIHRNHSPSQQMGLRGDGVQAAIAAFAAKNQRAIYYEGLTRSNQDILRFDLRRRGLKCEMRNARFDKHAEVRLADSLAAMICKVRFGADGANYTSLLCDWFVEL